MSGDDRGWRNGLGLSDMRLSGERLKGSSMKYPRYDFHIHTQYLGCANGTMQVSAIAQECKRLGVISLGITDHLNSLDKVDLHVPILQDIQQLEDPGIDIYFGVELNFTGYDQGFAFNQDIAEKYGFQFAIGGIHSTYLDEYDVKRLVDIQHRHHLKTCQDPLVQVLVHPYWFSKGEFGRHGWPWFNSMKVVPPSYVRELGQASKETGTAIEINGKANLQNPAFSQSYVQEYYEFLSILAQEGAIFCCGSDAHDISHLAAIQTTWQMAERLDLSPEQIWRPECTPIRV
jgi:histidinol phosphatase-like PHP family hydrolase